MGWGIGGMGNPCSRPVDYFFFTCELISGTISTGHPRVHVPMALEGVYSAFKGFIRDQSFDKKISILSPWGHWACPPAGPSTQSPAHPPARLPPCALACSPVRLPDPIHPLLSLSERFFIVFLCLWAEGSGPPSPTPPKGNSVLFGVGVFGRALGPLTSSGLGNFRYQLPNCRSNQRLRDLVHSS